MFFFPHRHSTQTHLTSDFLINMLRGRERETKWELCPGVKTHPICVQLSWSVCFQAIFFLLSTNSMKRWKPVLLDPNPLCHRSPLLSQNYQNSWFNTLLLWATCSFILMNMGTVYLESIPQTPPCCCKLTRAGIRSQGYLYPMGYLE